MVSSTGVSFKKVRAALILAAFFAFQGCGSDGSDPVDSSAGDESGFDLTGYDTTQPEVVQTEEQRQAFLRHAELVAGSDGMTFESLMERWYDRSGYLTQMPFDASSADFMPEIKAAFPFGGGAAALLEQNGFAVLDDAGTVSHPNLYKYVFDQDLPVFISADSIMFAVHKSYDEMLKRLEEYTLLRKVGAVLDSTAAALGPECEGSSGMVADACRDVDLYLTVARSLLSGQAVVPAFVENEIRRDEILAMSDRLEPKQFEMFGRPYPCVLCSYDFSQFKPRGHYTDSEQLKQYFRAMIWMGRTPMNITLYDRDLVASLVLLESLKSAGVMDDWTAIDKAIQVFVGKSDNMTPVQYVEVLEELAVDADPAKVAFDPPAVRAAIAGHGVPGSRILSQIMMMDVMSEEPTPIPAEFQLFGQRFVVDSYVFSNVVYDRITFNDEKPMRMMPDPLDAAFVLGFDEALPLLKGEIETWQYAGNLNVLRTMVDEYDAGFWGESMYNAWLDGIRAFGGDFTADRYPAAARTRAWALRSMQSALASWAELRHDTILYVKQSYSGEACEFPDGYVEPNPDFFARMKDFATSSQSMLAEVSAMGNDWYMAGAGEWFERLGSACDMLHSIAAAQIDGVPRTSEQTAFIKSLVVDEGMCGGPGFSGWYADLFFGAETETFNFKPTVADVHTDPNSTDVLHVATGGANPMIVVVVLESGPRAFVGPVSSFYQFREPGFGRLTDAEWYNRYTTLKQDAPRPSWAASFAADPGK